MKTELITDDAARAAQIIKSGGLAAVPTETVYGLAGNALDETAVRRISGHCPRRRQHGGTALSRKRKNARGDRGVGCAACSAVRKSERRAESEERAGRFELL